MKSVCGKLWRLMPVVLLSGCGGGGNFSTNGTLNLGVVDGPVDRVTQVVLVFTEVQVHSNGGTTKTFSLPTPRQVDLLAMHNGQQGMLLENEPLDAGFYDWVRLFVDESRSFVVDAAGQQQALQIPSDAQSGLKLNRSFSLSQGGVARFVIDFDLRKSLHLPAAANQPYQLRPTLRIVDVQTSGNIKGTVDAALVTGQGCVDGTLTNGVTGGVVYVYPGAGVTPSDIDSSQSAGQPVTTAVVKQDNNGAWAYTAAYLPAGPYTVAFTCQATSDLPDSAEAIVFQNAADVTVASGSTVTHDFP